MIRRPYDDGYVLITQNTHAWLSGQLALHWGNDNVSRPEPFETVLIGTILHDIAWMEKDADPLLNPKNQPHDFLEAEVDDFDAMYERGVHEVHQVDPYAALLVNRHLQTIYGMRVALKRDPIERLQPLLNRLKDLEESTLESLTTHPLYSKYIDDATLDHNYRILRTCDLLSLYIYNAFPAGTAQDVPIRYGEPYQDVVCEMLDEDTMRVSPGLFDQPELTIYLQARFIPEKSFDSMDDYREAYEKADFITLKKTIITD